MSAKNGVIQTAHLFRPLSHALIGLLRGLDREAWQRPTSAAEWTVSDVAAHMLDVDLRRLSSSRDGHAPPPPRQPVRDNADLVGYLNALNAEWVQAARRLSPRVLTDCLAASGMAVADLMEETDPWRDATFPVAWAGHLSSPMWLDIGREYTERWHHQDQIREAVAAPPLAARDWLRPVIDISLLALPHAYRSVEAPPDTRIALRVSGESGGDWHLLFVSGWELHAGDVPDAACILRTSDLHLARLLMHRLPADSARSVVEVEGPPELADPLLRARAVMVRTES